MTFRYAGNGGSCHECEWIAADGEITADTPTLLKSLLGPTGNIYHIYLNSPGGSLMAGLELGRILRSKHAYVHVGRSSKYRQGDFEEITPGICASACSYAFLGGERREAAENQIGVHRFSLGLSNSADQSIKLKDDFSPGAVLLLPLVQASSALLIDYAMSMGVDPQFVSIASKNDQAYYLHSAELKTLKVNWDPLSFEPWLISPWQNGVFAHSNSSDNSLSVFVFCRADGIPRLQITSRGDSDATFAALTVFGLDIEPDTIKAVKNNGRDYWEFPLKGLKPDLIPQLEEVWNTDAPQSEVEDWKYKLSKVGAPESISVALRNCAK